MIEVVPLKAEHVEWLKEHGGLGYLAQFVDREKLLLLEKTEAYTLLSHVGGVLACMGFVDFWPNRGEVWAMFNPRCRSQFLLVHRIAKRIVDSHQCRRLEATVDADFPQGHRWIGLLGFKKEALMKCYTVDGRDSILYAKIKGDT